MKKALLTIAVLTAGLTASAAVKAVKQENAAIKPGIPTANAKRIGTLENQSKVIPNGMKLSRSEDFNVITEAPEGKHVTMLGNSETFYIYFDDITMDESFGIAYDGVWTENGDVYLKNPISMLDWPTYIKGHETETGITFDFPQPLFLAENDNENYEFYIDVIDYVSLKPSEETRSITFEKLEDGSYSMMGEEMLGVTYNGTWQGYGEMHMNLRPFEATPVEVPEGIKYDYSYVLVDEFNGWDGPILRTIGIGEADGTTYISDLAAGLPGAVITATFDKENNTLTLPSDQFLGKFFNHYMNLMVGAGYTYWDDFWEEEMFSFDAVKEPMVLDFDKETKTFRPRLLEDKEYAYLIFNFGNTETYPCEYYAVDKIYSQGEITDYTPVRPDILFVNDISIFDPDYTYAVEFNVYSDNEAGQILPESNIYYNVLINGKPYTFTAEEYPTLLDQGVTELTDIPLAFNAENDIYAYGYNHGVALKLQDVETIGVRVLYIDGETRAESETVTVNTIGEPVDGSAVGNINSAVSAETEYFDLTGRKVSPFNAKGIIVKRSVKADGTVRTEKIVR